MLFPTCFKGIHRRGASYQKTAKREHVRTASEVLKLVPLEGKQVVKAPKIYSNQIFCDVYDSEGNHDRMLDVSKSIESGPKVIFKWDTPENSNPVQPIVPNRIIKDIFPGVPRHCKSRKRQLFS